MNRTTSPISRALALTALSSIAVLAGCGSSGPASNGEAAKPATQVFSDAQKATAAASSVHVVGHITSGGKPISLDFVGGTKRGGGALSSSGWSLQIVLAGQNVYLKGSAASFTTLAGNKAAGQLLGGRWLQTTNANKDFGSFSELFNVSKLVHAINSKSDSIKKGSPTTVDGQSVVTLIDAKEQGKLYVAATGPPYIVEITGGPKEPGTIKFNQYGSAKPPATPTGAINLDQLEAQS
jgi:hypothetical protein